MKSFVAIDFETANPKRVSACSLGFVKVINGAVVDKRSYLIKPIGEYSPMNIRIHGIRPEMTANAPTFDRIYPELKPDFEQLPVLSYSAFDRSVFEALKEYYALPLSHEVEYFDVYSFARNAIQGLPNYKLPTVSYHLQLPEFDHHDAVADALQCAEVFLRLEEMAPLPNEGFKCLQSRKESWIEPFTRFVESIIEDGTIDYKEAYELQCFLDAISNKGKLFQDIAAMTSDALEDGVITKEESDLLCALLRYALSVLRSNANPLVGKEERCCRSITPLCPNMPKIEVPEDYVPVRKDIPEKYRERWEYLREHPLNSVASANVVITETGVKISREQAESLVQRLGATLQHGVTRCTDFCIVLGMSPECCTTGKVNKARALQVQGSPIRILGEDEFIKLLMDSTKEGADGVK